MDERDVHRTRVDACLDEISRLQGELRAANTTLGVITNAVTADMDAWLGDTPFLHE